MVICGSYMFEFSVSKDVKKIKITMIKRLVPGYLLALIVKILNISVEQGRVVTTLNTIKH